MLKISLIALIVICAAASHAAADDALLEKLIALAEENNSSVFAANEKVNQAKAETKGTAARTGPSVTAEVSWRIARDIPVQAREAHSASLNLIQVIYAGNTLTARRKAAGLTLLAVKAEYKRARQEVIHSVRVNYYETRRALAQLNVADESLNMSREHLKQTESLFKAGMVPKGDVMRVKVSVSQAGQEKIRAESETWVMMAALERSVGAEISRDEILSSQSGDIEKISPPEYAISGDLMEDALAARPETAAYKFYSQRDAELVRAAKGEKLPQVTLSANANLSGNNYGANDDNWYLQLALQWSLYDGGERNAEIERLKSAAKELLYQIQGLNGQIRQEVTQAKARLDAAVERYAIARAQVSDAKEDYRLALRRYDARVGTNLDVLDSRSALISSLTAYVNAVYDIAIAQSGLIYAMGGI